MTNAPASPRLDFTFSALLFGLLGWMLLHAALACVGATLIAHVLGALFVISPVTMAFRRCRLYWLKFGKELTVQKRPFLARFLTTSNAAWGTLLLVIGAMLGRLFLFEPVMPLIAFSIGLTFVPWSRITLCRQHFVASISIIAVSAAFPLLITSGAFSAIHLAIGAWALLGAFMFAFILGR
jgi:hypothetical protein